MSPVVKRQLQMIKPISPRWRSKESHRSNETVSRVGTGTGRETAEAKKGTRAKGLLDVVLIKEEPQRACDSQLLSSITLTEKVDG